MITGKKIKYGIAALIIFSASLVYGVDNSTLYEQGMEAFNSGNYGSSELIFRKIIDSDDEDYTDNAWFFLARSIFHQKKYKSAIFEFNSFLNKCTLTDKCLEARFWIGESYYNLNDYVKAIEQYKRYIISTKDGELVTVSHDRIGSIYFTQKRYDEAIIEWDRSIDKSRDREQNALRILKIGDALFRSGKFQESLDRLTPLLTSNTNIKITAMARLLCGQIYLIENDAKKALLMLNGIPGTLLNEKPCNEAQFFKARAYLALGYEDNAKSLLEIFISMGKDSDWYYDAVFELGKILAREKDWKMGAVNLEEVRKSSGKAELRFQASKALSRIYMDKNPEAAIPYLEESLSDENPEEHKEILLMMGKVYINLKNFIKAEDVLDQFSKKYPFDKRIDEVIFLHAMIYLEKGEINIAMESFKKIQSDYPFSKYINESHYYLSLVYYKNGEFEKSVTNLKKYLSINNIENRYQAYVVLLDSYGALRDMKNAQLIMNYMIKNFIKNEGFDIVLFKYARDLYSKKLNAASYFSILINNFPESDTTMDLYLMLANDYYESKDFAKASQYYEKFIQGNHVKEKGTAYYNDLICLMELKKYDQVIVTINQGNVPPLNEKQWATIPVFLSRCYFNTGNLEKVYTLMYASDLSKYEMPDLLNFIKSCLSIGDVESARKTLDLIENNKNLYSEGLYLIGLFYLSKKQYDESKLYFSRVLEEYRESPFYEKSRMETAEICMVTENFNDAIKILLEIKDNGNKTRKDSMLIIAYFKKGEINKAVTLTNNSVSSLQKSEFGAIVFKTCMEYYYKEKNITEFNRFSQYLKSFKGNDEFINHLSAWFYYDIEYFKQAFYYFTQLSNANSLYSDESTLYLGHISMLVYNNLKSARYYFTKVSDSETAPDTIRLRAKINLAIISKETKRDDESKKYLEDIINSPDRGYLKTQALNLYELYGFAEKVNNGKTENPDN